MRNWSPILFILSLILPLHHPHTLSFPLYTSPAKQAATFTPAACMFDLPSGVEEGKQVRCGYVSVPEFHANPEGPKIQLAVVILKSQSENPKADPLFMAQGGPGGSTIDSYAQMLLSGNDLLSDRDIVLFDQRGTLYSKPNLYCTEIDQLTIETLNQDLSREESERLSLQALSACRKRLENQGINLSAFNSLENAADIEAIRLALGYEQINLYGVSYGTLLALHYMRQFPTSLRSIILDSVVPPQINFIPNVAETQNRAFTRLFAACHEDPACDREYPYLEKIFTEVVDQLNRAPARVVLTDFETGEVYPDAVIDGDTFLAGAFQMLYATSLIPALPRMIYDAYHGDLQVFARILAIIIFDRSTSYGMYYSVLCSEDADFSPTDQNLTGVRPQIAEAEKHSPEAFLNTCKMWNVTPLDPSVDEPVHSDIPTLALSGEFDPITPPAYAQAAVTTLTNSYSLVFPAGGHGQALDGDCQIHIVQSFLDNPNQAPDTDCMESIRKPIFYTHATVVDLPVILRLLNLELLPSLTLLGLIIALLFLWTSAVIFPIAWVIQRNQRPSTTAAYPMVPSMIPPSYPTNTNLSDAVSKTPSASQVEIKSTLLTKISNWLPPLASISLSLFLTILTITLARMVIENDNRLFYGVAGEIRPWFLLVWVFMLISFNMVAACIQRWRRRENSVAFRVYYTFLTFAALFCVTALGYLGMITSVF